MPINSMTGFASVAGETGKFDWRWDLKSVNGRGLDLRLRLPAGLEALEPKLRAAAQSRLKRGAVTATLTLQFQSLAAESALDEAMADSLVRALLRLRARLQESGIPVGEIGGDALLAIRGVLPGGEGAAMVDAEAAGPAVLTGFTAAVEALLSERQAEGKRLESIISEQVTQIESLTRDAAACADEAVTVLRTRLQTQIDSLLTESKLQPERLEQEVAVLAVKADVREEIDRLGAHVAAARELLAGTEPAGRRLDFLTQEFNREANTLCSKSATDRMTRIGLDLKSVIDQLKEQAANVE